MATLWVTVGYRSGLPGGQIGENMAIVEWELYEDEARSLRVARGEFPVQWIAAKDARGDGDCSALRVSVEHPMVVPEVAREARKMMEEGENETVFAAASEVFGLQRSGPDAGQSQLWCVMTVHGSIGPEAAASTEKLATWFDAKLHRAAFHRQRGNERFKRKKIKEALRSYENALEWLACPSVCEFSDEELEKVKVIAIPSHVNLATCHWKLGQMEPCIRHTTRALALDASHVKARFRRSQAYLQTKQYDEAIGDLELVVTAEPETKLFATSLERARRTRQEHRNKQKQAYAAAFKA